MIMVLPSPPFCCRSRKDFGPVIDGHGLNLGIGNPPGPSGGLAGAGAAAAAAAGEGGGAAAGGAAADDDSIDDSIDDSVDDEPAECTVGA